MSRFRKVVVTGTALAGATFGPYLGLPGAAELVTAGAVFLDTVLPEAGGQATIDPHDRFALIRAAAYQDFSGAVLTAFQAAGRMMTVKAKLVGALHWQLGAMRAQKKFEEAMFDAVSALSSIYLLGSAEAQQTGKAMLSVLAEQLGILGSTKQASPAAQAAFDAAGPLIGDALDAWRQAAKKDLGLNPTSPRRVKPNPSYDK